MGQPPPALLPRNYGKEGAAPMKRIRSLFLLLALLCPLCLGGARAAVIPNQEVLFTANDAPSAIQEIEARFQIKVTDRTQNGLSLETLHNLETALNYLSFDLFQEVVDHFRETYGITVELIFSPYTAQSYLGMTSLSYDFRSAACTVELVDTGNRFTSSGLDVDTMVHEFCHLLNYAMLDSRGSNPVEQVYLPLNNGVLYQDTYYTTANAASGLSWNQYVASLGDTASHYFVNNYAMTSIYEDFASLFQVIVTDTDVWESALLDSAYAPLLAKYRGSVALLEEYFPSAAASPLGDLFPAKWALADWQSAKALGLVPSALDRAYDAPITRLEFCQLMNALLSALWGEDAAAYLSAQGYDLSVRPFPDCDDASVIVLYALGVVDGRDDGTFAPNASITRQEAAKLLSVLETALTGGQAPVSSSLAVFTDADSIAGWAEPYVQDAVRIGVMQGNSDGAFAPRATYDRQQSIVTAYRLYQWVTQQTAT